MNIIRISDCRRIMIARLSLGAWSILLKWNREYDNGARMMPGFTGSAYITTDDYPWILAYIPEILGTADAMVREHEASEWPQLGVSDIDIEVVRVDRYQVPFRDIGIDIIYGRLDASGKPIPLLGGNLLYEYRDDSVGNLRNPERWLLSVNAGKRYITDHNRQEEIVSASERISEIGLKIVRQIDPLVKQQQEEKA